ncbi:MAG TPA: LOG family protein [Ignavibacteriaceae bacterium]
MPLTPSRKIITVFGSSKPVEGDEEYQSAHELGFQLAKNGFDVCTGGFLGVMEAASNGAVQAGGKAIGVTVDLWGSKPNRFVTKEIRCKSLFERIQTLINYGNAYVVLQGGTGTLLELAAVWEFSNKGLMDHKPILCHSAVWKEIVSVLNKQMEYEGRGIDLVKPFDTVNEIVTYLKKHFY